MFDSIAGQWDIAVPTEGTGLQQSGTDLGCPNLVGLCAQIHQASLKGTYLFALKFLHAHQGQH